MAILVPSQLPGISTVPALAWAGVTTVTCGRKLSGSSSSDEPDSIAAGTDLEPCNLKPSAAVVRGAARNASRQRPGGAGVGGGADIAWRSDVRLIKDRKGAGSDASPVYQF